MNEYLAMEVMWETESTAIRWIQGWGEWLSYPLGAVTTLGSQVVIVVLLAALFWCVNPKLGVRLFVAVIASSVLNNLLKSVVYGARPYWFDAQITAHSNHGSFGMPSGHTQAATVTWGYLGIRSGRRVWLWAAAVLIALVCLSRIYLGVHFISDVLAGLLLGGAVLWATLRWEDRIVAWWLGLDTVRWVGYALAAALVPCLAATLWQLLVRGDWTVPVDWIGSTPTDPAGYSLTNLYTASGALLGGLVGFTLLSARGWYSAHGTFISRVARFALGISVVVLVQVCVNVAFGALTGLAESVVTFVAYAGVTFWAAYGAPEMFIRSGLATRPEPRSHALTESAESAENSADASSETPADTPSDAPIGDDKP